MRTFEQAKAFARHEHQQPRAKGWFNCCQMFSRQCVGAPAFGVSARQAFNNVPEKHRHHTSPPPPGSIAYYGRADHGAGHAVFVVEGGKVWSNDILRHGRIDRVDWDIFIPKWGLAYRGWIDANPSGAALPIVHRASTAGFRQGRQVYRSKMRFKQPDSDSVWNLQQALVAHGMPFANGPTGYYGEWTRRACAAFQRRQGWKGVDADGIAGKETVRRLGLIWVNE
jgi:hypothetical protein